MLVIKIQKMWDRLNDYLWSTEVLEGSYVQFFKDITKQIWKSSQSWGDMWQSSGQIFGGNSSAEELINERIGL